MTSRASNISVVVALLLINCASSVYGFIATVNLGIVPPTDDVCDSQFNFVSAEEPFVCQPKPDDTGVPGEYVIQFDGPPQNWTGLPESIQMLYQASSDQSIDASGTFRAKAAIVSLDFDSELTGGVITDETEASCSITMDKQDVSANCGEMWIQTFTNDEGAFECRLNYYASIETPPMGPFGQLELTFEVPVSVQEEWENVCGSGTKEYSWHERNCYCYSGFTTSNHDGTVLAVTDNEMNSDTTPSMQPGEVPTAMPTGADTDSTSAATRGKEVEFIFFAVSPLLLAFVLGLFV